MALTGWSAYELARYTGLDQATISRIRSGNRDITYTRFVEALERAGFRLHLEYAPRIHQDDGATHAEPCRNGAAIQSIGGDENAVPVTGGEDAAGDAFDPTINPNAIGDAFDSDSHMVAVCEGRNLNQQHDHYFDVIPDRSRLNDPLYEIFSIIHDPPEEQAIIDGSLWERLREPVLALRYAQTPFYQRISFSRAVIRTNDIHWKRFLAGLYTYLRWQNNRSYPYRPKQSIPRLVSFTAEQWTPLPVHAFEITTQRELAFPAMRANTSESTEWSTYLSQYDVHVPRHTLIREFVFHGVCIPVKQLE